MSNQRFNARRTRVLLGGAVVVVSLAAAGVLGGVGLAKSSVSAAQYQYGKLVICHHTHSKKNPQHTITISPSAWKAHQKHGDTLGPCVPPTTTAPTTSTAAGATPSAPTPAASPGKSGQPHGNSGGHGNKNGHG
jgi:hypothetical protein